MNTGKKLQWLLGIAAGTAMLVFATGCETTPRDAVIHGEDFVPDESARSAREFVNMEAANAVPPTPRFASITSTTASSTRWAKTAWT